MILGNIPSDRQLSTYRPLNYHRVKEFIHSDNTAQINGTPVYSAFQPILSLAHKKIVGYEALARSGEGLPPFFQDSPAEDPSYSTEYLILADRVCRLVHTRNFKLLNDPANWLFLNIDSHTIMHGIDYGSFFKDMLAACDIPPHRVVVEIVEHPVKDTRRLNQIVEYYKKIGCLVAIDDFGAGHSNFERVWDLVPDIIKLDRSMSRRVACQSRIRRLLPGIVSLLHQAGALVLMEGVETENQALIALEADVDLVQGYYFARPTTTFETGLSPEPSFDMLFEKFKKGFEKDQQQLDVKYHSHKKAFQLAIEQLQRGGSLDAAAQTLFQVPDTIRCYLLHPSGLQASQNLISPSYRPGIDCRFTPLQSATKADWFRRHYLRRAVLHPGRTQITWPYRSITGENMCVTASHLFTREDGRGYVFCCDFLWQEQS